MKDSTKRLRENFKKQLESLDEVKSKEFYTAINQMEFEGPTVDEYFNFVGEGISTIKKDFLDDHKPTNHERYTRWFCSSSISVHVGKLDYGPPDSIDAYVYLEEDLKENVNNLMGEKFSPIFVCSQ